MSNGDTLYTNYQAPKKGKPTFVLVNGLVYSSDYLDDTVKLLRKEGYGILRYEFSGQNRSFVATMEDRERNASFLKQGLNLDILADELKEIIDFYNISGKIELVGLSYGSSIVTRFSQKYPQNIRQIYFMAPLVITLESYDPNGAMFAQWLDALKLWGPLGNIYSDYLYEMIYRNYFASAEKNVDFGKWTSQYRNALFEQVSSVRNFDLRKVKFPDLPIHLITAEEEQPRLLADQLKFWERLPENKRGTYVHLTDTAHAIPSSPKKAFAVLDTIQKSKQRNCINKLKSLL